MREESPLLGRRLEIGSLVGEYQIASVLEEGGMGTIYAAAHPVIGKQVAIKVLSSLLSQDETMTQRFIREARAVNQIQHDNIVDIFGFGRLPDGRLYYVMELLAGQSLKTRRQQETPLRYEEALSILAQICDALAAAHAQGIIHRDLKPDNVFLVQGTGLRTVKLLDFGIAKLIRRADVEASKTEAGLILGTPQYMSPEQCLSKEVDARTDVYSLGVIMFELFTGRVPFVGTTAIEIINGHLQQPPPVPKELAPVPDDLNDLVLQCLAKEPERRPASIAVVRERVLEISISQALGLDGMSLPVAAVVPAPPTHGATTAPAAAPKPPRKPLPPGLRYVGGAVVIAFAVFGLWMAIERLRGGGGDTPTPAAAAMSLQLLSDPPGATVTLDGQRQALLTPYVFELPQAPSVRVRLELSGHRPHEETVEFRPGERQKALRVALSPTSPRDGGPAGPNVGQSRPASQSPTIAILELDPSVAWIGEPTTISAQVSFDDPDGDVRSAVVEVKEGPARLRPQKVRLRVAGATGGTAAFSFGVAPSKLVPLTIDVWVTDDAGHTSNRLTAPLEVKAREPAPDAGPSPADAGP